MAKIVENEAGGRRMIRLSADDVLAIMSRIQHESRKGPTSPTALQEILEARPLYLPEEAS